MENKRKILLVDDSQEILLELKKELLKAIDDIEVLISDNYKDTLKLILKNDSKIDLAVIDINLNGSHDGTIVDVMESNSIKSIVLSSTLDKEGRTKIFGKKFIVDYIAKDGKKSIKSVVSSVDRQFKNIGKNVLIIDDSKLQLNAIQKILKKMNLNVTTATNGKDAYEIITESEMDFSLIITDYHMDGMDGMELTFKLRELYDKDELSIIVVTVDDNEDVMNEFLKIGANDFIIKGSSETNLITKVNGNLDIVDLFQKIKNMANKDYLTGAFNRRFFFDNAILFIDRLNRKDKNIALAMIDLDKFKEINDKYGHDIGDIVLRNFSDILKKQTRNSDLMCRFGGEEFAMLVEDISLENIQMLFEKIRKIVEDSVIKINGFELSFTISIGIAFGKVGKRSIDEIIKVADEALYLSKNNGRNKITLKELL